MTVSLVISGIYLWAVGIQLRRNEYESFALHQLDSVARPMHALVRDNTNTAIHDEFDIYRDSRKFH